MGDSFPLKGIAEFIRLLQEGSALNAPVEEEEEQERGEDDGAEDSADEFRDASVVNQTSTSTEHVPYLSV